MSGWKLVHFPGIGVYQNNNVIGIVKTRKESFRNICENIKN